MALWIAIALAVLAGMIFIAGILLLTKHQAKIYYQERTTWLAQQQHWQAQYHQRQGSLWKLIRYCQWHGVLLMLLTVAALAYFLWLKPIGFTSEQALALAALPRHHAVITQRDKIFLSCRRNNHCAYRINAEQQGAVVLNNYELGRDANSRIGQVVEYVTLNGQNHVVSEPLFDLRDELRFIIYSGLLGTTLIFGFALLVRFTYRWFIH